MKKQNFLLLSALATLAMTTGCASYRVESNIPSDTQVPMPASGISSETPAAPAIKVIPSAAISKESRNKVLISEDSLPGKKYKEVGPVEVSVKKLTIFHKDPTKEQADEALKDKAAAIAADAVVNVTYKSGVGLTTWGYMDAKGTAVKFEE
ncbi:heavy metal-binding domain-containing protein [Ottowia sp. VDI28]|uniref:heavy metal-binding domain-containing protein n=1 Tax=Ottowia sp. VDI28 TaxID=3133968 RepID=UPI003C2D5EA8